MKRAALNLFAILLVLPTSTWGQGAPTPPVYEAFDPVFYFRSGGVEIAPPNEEAWRKIEGFIRREPPGWLEVVGHADSAGEPEANMRLSARRGQVVAARLVAIGVDPGVIRIIACGEDRPAVTTGDSVAEPLNRRVSVDWGPGRAIDRIDPSCRRIPLADRR